MHPSEPGYFEDSLPGILLEPIVSRLSNNTIKPKCQTSQSSPKQIKQITVKTILSRRSVGSSSDLRFPLPEDADYVMDVASFGAVPQAALTRCENDFFRCFFSVWDGFFGWSFGFFCHAGFFEKGPSEVPRFNPWADGISK